MLKNVTATMVAVDLRIEFLDDAKDTAHAVVFKLEDKWLVTFGTTTDIVLPNFLRLLVDTWDDD